MQDQKKFRYQPASNSDQISDPVSKPISSNSVTQQLQQNPQFLQRIADTTPGLLYLYDRIEGRNIYVNRQVTELLGYLPDDFQAKGVELFPELMHPDDLARLPVYLEQLNSAQDGETFSFEYRLRHQNGEWHWFCSRDTVFTRTPEGLPHQILGTAVDITARKKLEARHEIESKQAELALKEVNQTLRTVINASPLPIVIIKPDSTVLLWNPAAERVFGWEEAEVLGKALSIVPDEKIEECQVVREAVARGEVFFGVETYRSKRDGSFVDVMISAAPLYSETGSAKSILLIFNDVTAQKQVESALRKSEETARRQLAELEAIYATAPVGLCFYDTELRYIRINERLAEMNGFPVAEHIGRTMQEIIPELSQYIEPIFEQIKQTKLPVLNQEVHGTNAAQPGVERDWQVNYYPLLNSNEELLGFNLVVQETTEQKRAEKILRNQAQIIDQIHDSVISTDLNGCITSWNKGAERIFGYSAQETLGQHISLLYPQPEMQEFLQDRVIAPLLVKGEHEVEVKMQRSSGEIMDGLLSLSLLRDENQIPIGMIGYTMDITIRKQVQEALRESEERFRQLAENVDDVFWILNPIEDKVLYVSPAFEKVWGCSCESLYADRTIWLDAVHPEDRERVETAFSQLALEGNYDQEYRILHPDGSVRWIRDRGYQIKDTSGAIYRIAGIAEDITERKQVEEILQESEQRTRLATTAASLGMWSWNPIADEAIWTEECKALFGLAPDTKINLEVFLNTLHPEDRQRVGEALNRCFLDEVDYNIECRVVWQDGSIHWIAANGRTFHNTQGQSVRVIGTAQDITSRKQAEVEREQMLARSQRYANQLNGLTEAALVINSALSIDGVLREITERARNIIGAHQSVTNITINKNWAQSIYAVSLSDKYAAWRDYDEQPKGSGIYAYLCQINRPMRMTQAQLEAHPQWRGFSEAASKHPPMRGWLAAPLVGRDGRNIGLIQLSDKYNEEEFSSEDEAIIVQLAQMASIAIENTRLYEESQRARTEAEAANRVKDEFLAVLSHELRTPLNPILGWSKILQNGKLNPIKTAEALKIIERNAKLQVQLIEDLLDVSKILRGKLTLNVSTVDLKSTILAALETVRLAAEVKKINIKTILPADNLTVSGDSGRLQQVFWNILTNAVKFTPSGRDVEVRLESDGKYAQIAIADQGKGISADFLPYVFDYFRQADGATTRKFGGLGLGLAIVRQIVEIHGGTVKAESAGEDLGATFTVKLPLLQVKGRDIGTETEVELELNPQSLQGMQILVVDDDTDSREFISFVLEQDGATVIQAASGFEALELLQSSIPDILISDIGMPEMDGYMLMQQVRSLPPEKGGQIPAIALTAYAGEYDQQQALAAGFQTHISKPADPESLVTIVTELIRF